MFEVHQEFSTGISKVTLTPTNSYPAGKNYIYIDTKDIDIIIGDGRHNMGWLFNKQGYLYHSVSGTKYFFHQDMCKKYLGYIPECVDHYNGVPIDNTDRNLNVVTPTQNNRNICCRGYALSNKRCFIIQLCNDGIRGYSRSFSREDDVAYFRGDCERLLWDDYGYDFLADRRGELDLLELEYSGQISSEEAIYRHVMRKAANNAWYLFRYDLFGYFRKHTIPEPKYDINELGRMVDPDTGVILCPFG